MPEKLLLTASLEFSFWLTISSLTICKLEITEFKVLFSSSKLPSRLFATEIFKPLTVCEI